MIHLLTTLRSWVLQLLALLSIASLLMGSSAAQATNKIPVTASFSILGDLCKVVGADRVEVTTLVGPNEDAHVFTPKATHAKSLAKTKLLVINGMHFEPWATKLAQATQFKGMTVVASKGVKPLRIQEAPHAHNKHAHGDHEDIDPHAWQNPLNVVLYVQNIAQALTQVDPEGAKVYLANSQAYITELKALDDWAKAQFSAIAPSARRVVTSHDAFGYLAQQYQIQFMAPQGVNTDAEPSAKQLAQLQSQMKKYQIKVIYLENMGNQKITTQLSKDLGLRLGQALYSDALTSTDQAGATYLKMMRHNITELASGMKGDSR